MPIGPTFTQANNDGQMDELLYMTGLLARRMNTIRAQRMEQLQLMQGKGMDTSEYSITPTISDIQMSHNLIVSSTYRPYIMTSFQYLKHNAGSGTPGYGNDVIFTMRTFGEFLSDSALLVELPPAHGSEVDLRTVAINDEDFYDTIVNGVPSASDNVNNYPDSVYDSDKGLLVTRMRYVDSNGNVLISAQQAGLVVPDGVTDSPDLATRTTAINDTYTTAINVCDYVHYAEFPMHALIKAVKFQVNSNEIDGYTQETDNFYVHFLLPPGKLAAYYKCVGQELPQDGFTGLITNAAVDTNTIPDSVDRGNNLSARKRVQVMTGYQTPAKQQPSMLGIYPNKFDHCRGIRKAIPVLAIPNTEREFTYTFSPQSKVLYTTPANVFVEKTVHVIGLQTAYVAPAGDNDIFSTNDALYHDTVKTLTPLSVGSTIVQGNFKRAEEYLNNVFIDPAIHDLYLERIGFSLTRVHRTQSISVNVSEGEHILSAFKWPLEYFFAGLRPHSNNVVNAQRNWWRFSYNAAQTAVSKISNRGLAQSGHAARVIGGVTTVPFTTETSFSGPGETVTYDMQFPTINKFKVSLQAIDLYEELDSIFYNAYLPCVYGNYHVNSTPDKSALFITFTFAPASGGSSEGHINVSRSREFAVRYISNIIGTGNIEGSGDFHAVGESINFWLASSGNLHLRFS